MVNGRYHQVILNSTSRCANDVDVPNPHTCFINFISIIIGVPSFLPLVKILEG